GRRVPSQDGGGGAGDHRAAGRPARGTHQAGGRAPGALRRRGAGPGGARAPPQPGAALAVVCAGSRGRRGDRVGDRHPPPRGGRMTAPVSFAHPWALWLLLLVLFTVALGRRRSGIRWRVATILRAATLALLALALSGPSVRIAVPGASVVFAVDRSLSITPDEQRAETAVVREALARMRSGDRAGVVTFAGRAVLRRPVEAHPAVEDPGPAVDPDATDIGGAIDLAVRMLPPEGVRRVVVLSDGAENRGD